MSGDRRSRTVLAACVMALRLPTYLAAAALAMMTTLVVLSAVMRYAIGAPFRFTEELVGLLFAAMAFLVWPVATLTGQQISVGFFKDRLPPGMQAVARWLSALGMLAFCFVFGRHAYDFATFSLRVGARSDVADISLFPWMALIPLVCGLIVGAMVIRWAAMRAGVSVPDLND